ncbi:hypothetical protein CEXT_222421 [Caerostris extrusa]|uniref:Uncharacterized protein n=1 Tax=Caerostris extrusa TaxID=172846 RepID=A0AAV4P0E2_CAEEX|nr:hypothetical protein CEXT_222421 [Caerostris extrusa]
MSEISIFDPSSKLEALASSFLLMFSGTLVYIFINSLSECLTGQGLGHGGDAEHGVQPLLLAVPGDGHAPPEEGHLVDVGEEHGGGGVDAEDADGGEGGDGADPEADEVGQGGDGDGDRRLRVRLPESLLDAQLRVGATPGCEEYERVVHSNACKVNNF